MDFSSGTVLAAKGENESRPIASLTKIMTALLTISEVKKLETTVVATKNSVDAGESEIYLEPGEKLYLRELIFALMLKSANDAALAIAESVSGRKEIFTALMNNKALEIGASNTSFMNPHGLDESGHYSTAYDIALIAREALAYPTFRDVVSTREMLIRWLNKDKTFKAYNHNKLISKYPFVKGIKTGYTRKSGHCLATFAEKDGKALICVVLNAPSAKDCYVDTLKLLDYGFRSLVKTKVLEKGRILEKIRIKNKTFNIVPYADLSIYLPFGDRSSLSYKFIPTINKSHSNLYGFLKVYYKGRLVGVSTADAVEIKP